MVWLLAAAFAVAVGTAALHSATPAPDVALTSIDGTTTRLGDLRGNVVLVNFWATTCVTCVNEMPMLAATYRKFAARGYRTFAVAMPYDRPDWVLDFQSKRRLPFDIVLDTQGELARAFDDTRVTPTTFLIDREGRVVKRYIGAPDVGELERRIERLLAG